MSSSRRSVTPNEVLKLTAPTSEFLCPLSANTYGIDFLSFRIRDEDSTKVVFEVSKDPNAPPTQYPEHFDLDQLRSINYTFPIDFLHYRTVGTKLIFKVGNQEVRNFRMIERHFSAGKLIKSYDFTIEFCIPDTINEWEAIYDMPKLSDRELKSIIDHGSQSDSFYFVGNQLIMHNKATYKYNEDGQ